MLSILANFQHKSVPISAVRSAKTKHAQIDLTPHAYSLKRLALATPRPNFTRATRARPAQLPFGIVLLFHVRVQRGTQTPLKAQENTRYSALTEVLSALAEVEFLGEPHTGFAGRSSRKGVITIYHLYTGRGASRCTWGKKKRKIEMILTLQCPMWAQMKGRKGHMGAPAIDWRNRLTSPAAARSRTKTSGKGRTRS